MTGKAYFVYGVAVLDGILLCVLWCVALGIPGVLIAVLWGVLRIVQATWICELDAERVELEKTETA